MRSKHRPPISVEVANRASSHSFRERGAQPSTAGRYVPTAAGPSRVADIGCERAVRMVKVVLSASHAMPSATNPGGFKRLPDEVYLQMH